MMSADDAHRRLGRVDVGVADHELLQDVVLDGPAQLLLRHALLFGRDHVAGEHRQHRAVHRHRHADLVERDAVEQDLHVLDRVDRHAGLADVAGDARVVAVVAAVRGEVEGHADALRRRRPAPGDRRRCSPRRSRSPRTGGSSTAAPRTSSACGPRTKGSKPGSVSACGRPCRSAAVYSGLTVMPSGVTQFRPSRRPPGAALAAALAPLLERGGAKFTRLRHLHPLLCTRDAHLRSPDIGLLIGGACQRRAAGLRSAPLCIIINS